MAAAEGPVFDLRERKSLQKNDAQTNITLLHFKEAYFKMFEGKKIKRKEWRGYWMINSITGILEIHNGDGSIITGTDNLMLTIGQTIAEDWIVLD